jgi:hypothetical protein
VLGILGYYSHRWRCTPGDRRVFCTRTTMVVQCAVMTVVYEYHTILPVRWAVHIRDSLAYKPNLTMETGYPCPPMGLAILKCVL